MTVWRQPGSIDDAIAIARGVLGNQAMADAVGRSISLIDQWAHPQSKHKPNLLQAAMIDAAYVRKTGESPPILRALTLEIERLSDRPIPKAHPTEAVARLLAATGTASASVMGSLSDNQYTSEERRQDLALIGEAEKNLQALKSAVQGHAGPREMRAG
ncbi:MAG: hypothetical protein AAF354_07320 [Pseudomonadota bacterium]